MRSMPATLAAHEHLASVLESVRDAMAASADRFELRLCVEETQPIGLWWLRSTPGIGFGVLHRGDRQAVLVALLDAGGTFDAGKLRELRTRLGFAHPGIEFGGSFDWLGGTAPPIAAMIYCTPGDVDVGLNTVAMLVASVFLDDAGDAASGYCSDGVE
jgi:hypothetical protein